MAVALADKGQAPAPYFNAPFHAGTLQGALQRHGAVGDGNGIFGILVGGKGIFKLGNFTFFFATIPPAPPDATVQHLDQCLLFTLVKDRPRFPKGAANRVLHHRR